MGYFQPHMGVAQIPSWHPWSLLGSPALQNRQARDPDQRTCRGAQFWNLVFGLERILPRQKPGCHDHSTSPSCSSSSAQVLSLPCNDSRPVSSRRSTELGSDVVDGILCRGCHCRLARMQGQTANPNVGDSLRLWSELLISGCAFILCCCYVRVSH